MTLNVFICGLHRSGTSLLHSILRAHPDISGFANSGAPEDEGQHLQNVFPTGRKFGGPGKFCLDARARITEKSALVTDENRNKLLEQWGRHWEAGKQVLLEKSPPNIIRSRFLQAMFPQSCFIFLLRHPIAVSLATQKWSKTTLPELVEHWCRAHEIMQEDIPHLNKHLLLRYEDLVNTPGTVLQTIYDFLELPAHPTEENFKADINEDYFRTWEAQVSDHADLLPAVESHSTLPNMYGYSFRPPYVRDYR